MLQLTFKQTHAELIVRAASTVLFSTLSRQRVGDVTIADLAERPQYGFTASATSAQVGPKFVRITDLQDDNINWRSVPFCECSEPQKYVLRESDILFARTGATTGKTHFVRTPERAVFASYLIRLRPKRDVEAGYLHAFFQSDNYWSQILEQKEGSAQPNVNGEKLAALKIPFVSRELQRAIAEFIHIVRRRQNGDSVALPLLPPPLADQPRVVARIEELAAQIHEAKSLRCEAAAEAQVLISRTATSLLDEGGWSTLPLGNILAEKPRNGLSPQQEVDSGGRTMLRINAVSSSPSRYVDMTAGKQVEVAEEVAQQFVIKNDDVFIVRYNGDINRVAKPAIYKGANESRVVYPDKLIRLCTDPAKMNPDFLVFALSSRTVRSQIEELGKTTAGNIGVSGSDVQSFIIPVPPLPDQRRIVSKLDQMQAEVDTLKRLQTETAVEIDALLPSILSKAFAGEL